MASIVNLPTYSRIYDKDKIDVSKDLQIDNANMDKAIEDNMSTMIIAAKTKLKSRKPIYDFKTKNKSFLDLYNDLFHLGITNNKFFLKLYDPDLIGIDPYQRILPIDLQLKIILECIINPWYYLREICRIPEDGCPIEVGGGTMYNIDRNNVATWYLFLNGIDAYQSKPRQQGKTQDELAKMCYAYHFGALSSNFLFFSKDLALAKTNLYRFKCQRDMLPEFMQMRLLINEDGSTDKGTNNITTMRNPITGNTVTVMPAATSKDTAIRLGRGATAAFQHYDEFDFIPFIETIMNTAAFAFSKASENAAKNKGLYSRLFSSTPGDMDQRDGAAADAIIKKMLTWTDNYLDMPINKLKAIVRSVSYNGIVYVEHTWRQLKLSMEWYEKQCQSVSFDEETILREIDLKRIKGSSRSPFKRSDIIYINNHIREPIMSRDYSKNLCPIYIYETLYRNYPYILAVDPAEGLAQDNSAITLINPYTQEAAAEFQSPYISQTDLAALTVKFMDEFCPKAMITPESNKGREYINRMLETKYRYQIYYDIDKLNSKIVDTSDEYGALRQKSNERRAYGFDTTKSSRPKLFTVLETLVEEQKEKLFTKFIVEDISGLERRTSGRIEAAEKHHDDNVISYILGLYVYYHASNLEEFGIIRGASSPHQEPVAETPEMAREKIRSLIGSFQGEDFDMFRSFLDEKDPVKDAWDNQKIVSEALRELDIVKESGHSKELETDDYFYDEQTQQAFDMGIFESNYIVDTTVDIESIVDR